MSRHFYAEFLQFSIPVVRFPLQLQFHQNQKLINHQWKLLYLTSPLPYAIQAAF